MRQMTNKKYRKNIYAKIYSGNCNSLDPLQKSRFEWSFAWKSLQKLQISRGNRYSFEKRAADDSYKLEGEKAD